MKHLFILNPAAGGKKGRFEETAREIKAFSKELDAPFEIYTTREPMDACRKVALEAELNNCLRVYACGGDGTLNECANGAVGRANAAVTHYPCGTGNDFIRTFGKENVPKFRDLNALTNGAVHPIDLIDCNGRYGINICSVGIDARVARDVHKYSKIPIIGGATGYVTALAVNIIRGVKQRYRITTADGTMDKEVTLICACNGKFYGCGFNPVPEALPDDGIIEYLIIKGVSRLKVAQITKRYAQGRFRELEKIISYIRGERMEIEGEREFVINVDGETITAEKITFNVVPNGVNFIFPFDI